MTSGGQSISLTKPLFTLHIGGETTKRGAIPFAALLGYKNPFRGKKIVYKCGGTLINRRYVLTAAHCHDTAKETTTIVEVVLGEHDVSKDPDCPKGCKPVQRFAPEQVILHPNYKTPSGNCKYITIL